MMFLFLPEGYLHRGSCDIINCLFSCLVNFYNQKINYDNTFLGKNPHNIIVFNRLKYFSQNRNLTHFQISFAG